MKFALSYKDVVLKPQYSEIISRSTVDCSVTFLGRKFNSVAIPANMKCTIDYDLAEKLSELNYFYILHRFYDYESTIHWVKKSQNLRTISISVGIQNKDYELIDQLEGNNLRVDFITIDVAHGHHVLVKRMIKYIKKSEWGKKVRLIAGNIGTNTGARDLINWGADAVKVGLSMGKSCTTYNCTGVGTPMFSTLKSIYDVPIIADGQIREVGDVCKALVAGASMVMIGSEFARCTDSPAKTIKRLECPTAGIYTYHKEFFGSASEYNKDSKEFIEGQLVLLPRKEESYEEYFKQINQGVQSCMSYGGYSNIKSLSNMDYSARLV